MGNIKNLFYGSILAGLSFLPFSNIFGQEYDSLKTLEVVENLQESGFNLKGSFLNNLFQIQMDYNGSSKLINCPVAAEKEENDSLMVYPLFVAFNKNNSETKAQRDFVNGYGGFGFILDDNNIPSSVYADSIKNILKGEPTGVKSQNKKSLESKVEAIYPNPSNGYINVKYNSLNSKINFQIYDFLGREVYSIQGETGEGIKRINTGNLPSGNYFLKAGNEIKKFIILK